MPKIMQTELPIKKPTAEQQVHLSDQRRLANCPYSFILCKVTGDFEDGKLTLHGCVPSFYLKQTLQELLRGIEQVKQIDNQVDVVNSSGLSSVPPFTMAQNAVIICNGVTPISWPIGNEVVEYVVHLSSGRSRPADSPGNPTPVRRPNPNERRMLWMA